MRQFPHRREPASEDGDHNRPDVGDQVHLAVRACHRRQEQGHRQDCGRPGQHDQCQGHDRVHAEPECDHAVAEQDHLLSQQQQVEGDHLAKHELKARYRGHAQAVPGAPGPLVEQVLADQIQGEHREENDRPRGDPGDAPAQRLRRRVDRAERSDHDHRHRQVADDRAGIPRHQQQGMPCQSDHPVHGHVSSHGPPSSRLSGP